MSDWPWASPEVTRRALADRIGGADGPTERPARMREVAYRRLLARLFAARPDGWVVKRGVALLLRLDPNRTSNDIDITYIDEAGEHGVALEALREDASLDLNDLFAFQVGAPEQVVDDHPTDRTVAVPVIAYLGVKEWARFSVDLALPRPAVPA